MLGHSETRVRFWLVTLAGLLAHTAIGAVKLQPIEDGGGEAYKLRCTIKSTTEWPLEASAELVFDAASDGSCYAVVFEAAKIRLVRRGSGGHEALLDLSRFPPLTNVPLQVVLARDRWRIRVMVNGEVRLTAFDDTLPAGDLAYGTSTDTLQFADLANQPTEPIWFTDDFMRASDATGQWRALSGKWVASGVSQADALGEKRPDPNRSSNPFAYRVTRPGDGALSVTGQWFWETYRYSASVRAAGEGEVGLTLYTQDQNNYLALRWASSRGGAERQLVLVQDGREKLLGVANGGWADDQWYRLSIANVDGCVKAWIDDELVLSEESPAFGCGRIGLFAAGVEFADFDDVEVESTDDFDDTFALETSGRWQAVNGRWGEDASTEAPRNHGVRTLIEGDDALSVTGLSDWANYRISTVCHADSGGGVGLVCNFHDTNDLVMLRWGDRNAPSAYRNKLQLVRVKDGESRLLGEVPVGFKSNLWHTLSLENRRGFIRASVGGSPIFEAFEPDLQSGKPGLLASGREVTFDDCQVEFLPPEPKVEFTEVFTEDDYMTNWAQARGSWWVDEAPKRDGVIWHRGDFYGDCQLAFDTSQLAGGPRAIRLILNGDGENAASGYSLLVARQSASEKQATGQIQVAGRGVREAKFPLEDAKIIKFARRGRFVLGYVDERCVIGYYDGRQQTEMGIHAGVQASGAPLDLNKVDAQSDNSYDTTFHRAPVKWLIGKGVWETINRWKCDPRWSFFGGYNSSNPIIWSKDDYAGDIQIEAYMGIKMDLPGPPYYLHPSDLCVAVAGDGKDILSGTTFLFAARNNTGSSLYSQGKEIATSTKPEAKFLVTGWDNETKGAKFHRHWFHLVLRKAGGRITCSVDEKPIFDVADPNPGSSGKVALYSVNNGVMIARCKVWYEKLAERQPFPEIGALQAKANTGVAGGDPFANSFEQGIGCFQQAEPKGPVMLETTGRAAEGRSCLAVTNLQSGGPFAVQAVGQKFSVAERPQLTFMYKLSPLSRVNVYLLSRGTWYVLKLSGSSSAAGDQQMLGSFEDVAADNRWHLAQMDLKDAFNKRRPGQPVEVEQVRFAMMEPEPYLSAGFGVNLFGTTYYLDDFRLGP